MTADYLSFFETYAELSPVGIILMFLMTLFRIAPIVGLAPFLGAKIAPTFARASIALSISVIFLPIVMVNSSNLLETNMAFVGFALKELLIGLVLGFLTAIPFYVVTSAGIYIDYLRGASIMQSQDPSLAIQASPIGILYNYFLILIFFQIDGPFYFFEALRESYELVPVDSFFDQSFFSLSNALWKTILGILNHIVSIGLQLAAPSLLAILMAEMFLGIANRLAPQVQIAFLGMSLKSLLGLFLLWAAWFFVLKQFAKQSFDWLKTIQTIIQQAKYFIG
ncbi:MAG: flagellar biosynthetic protein FliR [Simkaniaceae bacterium]|nr:flagellar biosynthetic protein FliR [Simkaniaceae bacterium]